MFGCHQDQTQDLLLLAMYATSYDQRIPTIVHILYACVKQVCITEINFTSDLIISALI